jgi:two-component system chemotaxis sensor kinase CheA
MDLTFDLEPGDDLVYVAEAIEQIERIEHGLLALERDAEDPATLAEIFRAAHTLKGSASTIGHDRMAELTHALEEVFGALRSGRLRGLAAFDTLLLPTVDVLRILVDEIAAGHTLTDEPARLAAAIMDRLAAAQDDRGEPEDAVATRSVLTFSVDPASGWSGIRMLQGLMAATETGRVIGSVPSLDEIEAGTDVADLSVELDGAPTEFEGLLERLRGMEDAVQVDIEELDATPFASADASAATHGELPPTRQSTAHTIRIEVSQLDELMDFVGELIVQKTRMRRQARLLGARLGEDALAIEAEAWARQFAQIVDRLQASVTNLRMLPIETVFSRFPRLVHDLSAQLDKDIGLILDGGETELDRSLLEEIGDPLAHLIRNALDHGIEPGPDRVAAGKPERGTIRVTARHVDGRVVVEVADDGRGMDPRAIAGTAVERGLLDPAAATALTDAEALRLVFLPGFSTAREVTAISGRGVGMDVVLTNVERIGGRVSISSTPGSGTTIAMSLPLTLAIIDALLVRSGRRICAIPLRSIVETRRMPRGDVRVVGGQPVLNLSRAVVPLRSLSGAMGDPDGAGPDDGYVRAVLVRSRDAELALGVDAFLGTEEIVLKSLGVPGDQPFGIVGATILADGGVALVVDVDRLVAPARTHLRSA